MIVRWWSVLLLVPEFRSRVLTRSSSSSSSLKNGVLLRRRSVAPWRVSRNSAASLPSGIVSSGIALPSAKEGVVIPIAVTPRNEPFVQLSLRTTVGLGSLLALNAGYWNGLGLQGALGPAPAQSVSVVTGAWTHSALQFAKGNPSGCLRFLNLVVSYMLGAGITGFLNPFAQARRLSKFRVSSTLGVGTLLLALAALVHIQSASSMPVYYFLAAANGLQNALTSTYSGKLIRSTHLTGLTSDTGTYLGEWLQHNRKNTHRIAIHGLLAMSFWSGAALSYFLSRAVAAATILLLPSMLLYSGLAVVLLLWKPTDPKTTTKAEDV